MYWDGGVANAPELVQRCIKSWRDTNPGWDLIVLDSTTSRAQVDLSYLPDGTRVQLIADALRVELLTRYGGVWADATCLCTRPLDDWLPARTANGFFAFHRPGPDRPLANWFLAASPSDRLITTWRNAMRTYWREGHYSGHLGQLGRVDQFISHYLFEWMICANGKLGTMWEAAPTLPAGPPHTVQKALRDTSGNRDLKARALTALAGPDVPVHKLDWRSEGGLERLDALLAEANN